MNWDELFLKRNHHSSEYSKLNKISQKLEELGFKKTFKIFNIVGTNGKGSVSEYLTHSFMNAGKNVGTFTSPHIDIPNERIRTNNENITDKDFFKIANKLPEFSFFEILYIVAMIHFQNQNIDIAIVEAGLGGKKDATNSIPGDYGTITSVGLDHQDLLGSTVEEIARDKNEIRNEDMIFYVPSEIGKTKNIFLNGNYKIISNDGETYKERNKKLVSGILSDFNILPKFVEPKGRSEIKKINGITAIIDVAHNKEGIIESLKYLESERIKFKQVVITMNKSKDVDGIKDIFKNKDIYYYQLNDNFHNFSKYDFKRVEDLKKFYNNQNKSTLYIGSFYTLHMLRSNKDE